MPRPSVYSGRTSPEFQLTRFAIERILPPEGQKHEATLIQISRHLLIVPGLSRNQQRFADIIVKKKLRRVEKSRRRLETRLVEKIMARSQDEEFMRKLTDYMRQGLRPDLDGLKSELKSEINLVKTSVNGKLDTLINQSGSTNERLTSIETTLETIKGKL